LGDDILYIRLLVLCACLLAGASVGAQDRTIPTQAVPATSVGTADVSAAPVPGEEGVPGGIGDYRLQPGDVLLVAVWKEPELSGEVLIRPDGTLAVPLSGEVRAAGRRVEEVRVDIETRLRRYVPEAVVTLSTRALAGNRVYIIGKVARPGDFPLLRPTDVMQALALAGGTTPFADVNDIKILRRDGDGQRVLTFRLGDVERGKRLEQNVLLESGDTVIVP
jgi:polysaccharide export outer membrane protein